MAGSRTLVLSLKADTSDYSRGMTSAGNDADSFGKKLGDFGKAAGAAFALAGAAAVAYAGKLAIDGVKAAIEDEAAQAKLATTLQNTTGATNDQVAAVESYISKTQLAFGVTDQDLRPSLERLLRATKDVEEAQKLQTLALDVSAGSGKSLEAVSNALGKAYEGNTGALSKLGVGLTAAQLKTMDMDAVTAALAETFGGQASKKADTFAGKMARVKEGFEEAKETVGSFILDALTPLVSGIAENVIPNLQAFGTEMGTKLQPIIEAASDFIRDFLVPYLKALWEEMKFVVKVVTTILGPAFEGLHDAFNTIKKAIDDNSESFKPLIDLIKSVATWIGDNLAPVIGAIVKGQLQMFGDILGKIIGFIGDIISGITTVISKIKAFGTAVGNSPIGDFVGAIFGGGKASGGPVKKGTTYLVGENGPELFTPTGSGTIIPNGGNVGGGGITINVTGTMMDPEGVARAVATALRNSANRGGSYSTLGLATLGV